jgi:hypothetical protein
MVRHDGFLLVIGASQTAAFVAFGKVEGRTSIEIGFLDGRPPQAQPLPFNPRGVGMSRRQL